MCSDTDSDIHDDAAIHVVGAAIVSDGRCLVARRSASMSPPCGCWEFPGGKVEHDETPAAALEREIGEELRVAIEVGRSLGCSRVTTADGRAIRLEVFVARLVEPDARPRPVEHDAVRWIGADELDALDWAPADVPFLAELRDVIAAC